MNARQTICLLLILALAILIAALFGAPRPTVIVNMPADARPLSSLTQPGDKVIGPERAVLWWSVYSKAIESPSSLTREQAANYADRAVAAVYGPAR